MSLEFAALCRKENGEEKEAEEERSQKMLVHIWTLNNNNVNSATQENDPRSVFHLETVEHGVAPYLLQDNYTIQYNDRECKLRCSKVMVSIKKTDLPQETKHPGGTEGVHKAKGLGRNRRIGDSRIECREERVMFYSWL